jgi:hypothetical protein
MSSRSPSADELNNLIASGSSPTLVDIDLELLQRLIASDAGKEATANLLILVGLLEGVIAAANNDADDNYLLARTLLKALYIVGGPLRDLLRLLFTLMGYKLPDDFDLTTNPEPFAADTNFMKKVADFFQTIFQNLEVRGKKVTKVTVDPDTAGTWKIGVIWQDHHVVIDLSQFKKEGKDEVVHATIDEESGRRDIKFNALYVLLSRFLYGLTTDMDDITLWSTLLSNLLILVLNGEILDPTGQGIEGIKRKIISIPLVSVRLRQKLAEFSNKGSRLTKLDTTELLALLRTYGVDGQNIILEAIRDTFSDTNFVRLIRMLREVVRAECDFEPCEWRAIRQYLDKFLQVNRGDASFDAILFGRQLGPFQDKLVVFKDLESPHFPDFGKHLLTWFVRNTTLLEMNGWITFLFSHFAKKAPELIRVLCREFCAKFVYSEGSRTQLEKGEFKWQINIWEHLDMMLRAYTVADMTLGQIYNLIRVPGTFVTGYIDCNFDSQEYFAFASEYTKKNLGKKGGTENILQRIYVSKQRDAFVEQNRKKVWDHVISGKGKKIEVSAIAST